eukprot:gb/GECG01009141.1/.p1 GENE.gb/GECG01009141.1/~~gb/GECG01009141.1/.p1  ORF type:complete len:122 (+),score=3.52 gb/GECG01009141.1/:1-366(+)
MSMCTDSSITDDAFVPSSCLTRLDIRGCNQSTITDAAFRHLSNLVWLKINDQHTITEFALIHLSKLTVLDSVSASADCRTGRHQIWIRTGQHGYENNRSGGSVQLSEETNGSFGKVNIEGG